MATATSRCCRAAAPSVRTTTTPEKNCLATTPAREERRAPSPPPPTWLCPAAHPGNGEGMGREREEVRAARVGRCHRSQERLKRSALVVLINEMRVILDLKKR